MIRFSKLTIRRYGAVCLGQSASHRDFCIVKLTVSFVQAMTVSFSGILLAGNRILALLFAISKMVSLTDVRYQPFNMVLAVISGTCQQFGSFHS